MMCTTTAFANPPHHSGSSAVGHDGTWWQSKSQPFKDGFIIGYKDGIKQTSSKTDALAVGSAQMIDGLDHFYKDFRNVNVQAEDAMPYVSDELSGKSDDALAAELQTLRKNAAAAAAAKGDQ